MSIASIIAHDNQWESSAWRGRVRRLLINWFQTNQRDLPWRKTQDPYSIWISEIMLQQTQVATVIPYYEKFLRRFPNVIELAAAEEDEVLRYWEGLGYYRRARQMHAAAKEIIANHQAIFPTEFTAVLTLPGIGRYTAGAILSISRDQKLPVVEANTVRLYSRLIALRTPPAKTAKTRLLWQVAEALLPTRGSGQFNQAAMELGSLICTPKQPQCATCPLVTLCPTYASGLQESIPGRVKKIVYENRTFVAVVARLEDRFFLRQCGPNQHWAGLWDFPRYDVTGIQAEMATVVETAFADEFGFRVTLGKTMPTLKHGVTKYRITLLPHLAIPRQHQRVSNTKTMLVREHGMGDRGWYTLEEMTSLPLNTTGRKLVDQLYLGTQQIG